MESGQLELAPHLALDALTIGDAAAGAAGCADQTNASLAAARFGLDAVAGSLRTVAALRTCAAACVASTTELADAAQQLAGKLTDSIAAYADVDRDVAAILNAILGD